MRHSKKDEDFERALLAEIQAAVEEGYRTDAGDFIPHEEVMRKMRDRWTSVQARPDKP